jgi:aryl-alcohol dehydrogenase-like predicted oxidoreductase
LVLPSPRLKQPELGSLRVINIGKNQALLARVAPVGHPRAWTLQPSQAKIKRVLRSKGPEGIPIPGTTKLYRLDENIGAVSVEVTKDDLLDHGARPRIPKS